MQCKRVAIIGAGASGLTAIKCCLDEGLEPVCFERGNYIGGLWHYTDEVEEGQACVMKNTVINTSKEMMCYSNFPIPGEYPIYMHNTLVDKYLNTYAAAFELNKYINFNTKVTAIKRAEGFSENGQWVIQTSRPKPNSDQTHTFDAVLICTGHHADKHMAKFPGMENFKGTVVHTHDYKDYHGFENKRVLIIGIGNSGCDVATEISRISSQVYLSTRRGAWLVNRVYNNGDPFDMVYGDRLSLFLSSTFTTIFDKMTQRELNKRFNYERYSLQPKHSPLAAYPTFNDELPNRIISGSVIIKCNVKEFTDTGVVFEDGSTVENIDIVVMATGYVFGFPFLDNSVLDVKDHKVSLYKYMFPPDSERHTLAVIGCFQPLGAIMPISEMQCRVATRVFKGDVTLPSRSSMWSDINAKRLELSQRYYASNRHTMLVDYIPFMDELAEMIGTKPNLGKLLLTDPKLAIKCYFEPATPYQYRLIGPGAWSGAREAIMTQWDRTYQPLKTRDCNLPHEQSAFGVFHLVALAIVVIAVTLFLVLYR